MFAAQILVHATQNVGRIGILGSETVIGLSHQSSVAFERCERGDDLIAFGPGLIKRSRYMALLKTRILDKPKTPRGTTDEIFLVARISWLRAQHQTGNA